jgi:hypothetical protein
LNSVWVVIRKGTPIDGFSGNRFKRMDHQGEVSMKMFAAALLVVVMATATRAVVFSDDTRFVFSEKTVADTRTGLMWTRDADLGMRDWDGAFEMVKMINKKKYAGYGDWRLPGKEEVETLAAYAKASGYDGRSNARSPYRLFNRIGFRRVQDGHYWSSSTVVNDPEYAWLLGMNNGFVENLSKQFPSYVWPVRGGK